EEELDECEELEREGQGVLHPDFDARPRHEQERGDLEQAPPPYPARHDDGEYREQQRQPAGQLRHDGHTRQHDQAVPGHREHKDPESGVSDRGHRRTLPKGVTPRRYSPACVITSRCPPPYQRAPPSAPCPSRGRALPAPVAPPGRGPRYRAGRERPWGAASRRPPRPPLRSGPPAG